MSKKKLRNAPLKEVIFELFWKMSTGTNNKGWIDPGYNLAIGGFANSIKSKFPIRKQVLPDGISIYPHPQFQFWKEEATWPVIQIGPGMLTINDTDKNYSWEDNFRSNIEYAIEILIDSYEDLPKFEKARLQYIDAIDLPEPEVELEKIISDKLQTSIHRGYNLPGQLKELAIDQSYSLDTKSVLKLKIRSGRNNLTSSRSIIWTIMVETTGLLDSSSINEWLDSAHKATSETFVKMLNPAFYEYLDS